MVKVELIADFSQGGWRIHYRVVNFELPELFVIFLLYYNLLGEFAVVVPQHYDGRVSHFLWLRTLHFNLRQLIRRCDSHFAVLELLKDLGEHIFELLIIFLFHLTSLQQLVQKYPVGNQGLVLDQQLRQVHTELPIEHAHIHWGYAEISGWNHLTTKEVVFLFLCDDLEEVFNFLLQILIVALKCIRHQLNKGVQYIVALQVIIGQPHSQVS